MKTKSISVRALHQQIRILGLALILLIPALASELLVACVHTDRETGLSWYIPTRIRVQNNQQAPFAVDGTIIPAGESRVFEANEEGSVHVAHARQMYKLSYPVCDATNTDSVCATREHTASLTSRQIIAAIDELNSEQKEIAWVHDTADKLNLSGKGPIDELCITNDSPYPVKISSTYSDDTPYRNPQTTLEPGQSYSAIIPASQQASARESKKRTALATGELSNAQIARLLIDQMLGEEKKYEIQFPRRTSKSNNAITQAALTLSALQRINTGFRIERIGAK